MGDHFSFSFYYLLLLFIYSGSFNYFDQSFPIERGDKLDK